MEDEQERRREKRSYMKGLRGAQTSRPGKGTRHGGEGHGMVGDSSTEQRG